MELFTTREKWNRHIQYKYLPFLWYSSLTQILNIDNFYNVYTNTKRLIKQNINMFWCVIPSSVPKRVLFTESIYFYFVHCSKYSEMDTFGNFELYSSWYLPALTRPRTWLKLICRITTSESLIFTKQRSAQSPEYSERIGKQPKPLSLHRVPFAR